MKGLKEMKTKVMKNKEMGRIGLISEKHPLNLDKSEEVHTNPDGTKVVITKVTDGIYFSNRSKEKYKVVTGSSWLFQNHLIYSGWLWMNGFQQVDTEELEGKHC